MKYIISNTKGIDGVSNTIINTTDDVKEVNKIINDYIKSIEFKSYYWRTLIFEDEYKYIIDYGSYSDFIRISCDTQESFKDYLTKN